MDERQAFLKVIAASPWDDEAPRLVYADWLDEQGEHEEANRQRDYVPSDRWLREFAVKHFGYSDYDPEIWGEEREENLDSAYGQLMFFLKRHVDEIFQLPFDTPYDFEDYSEELWKCFEVVSGMKAPQGTYRDTLPPFHCAC
jgi:uncharacterized protein (TIGR02996 family)